MALLWDVPLQHSERICDDCDCPHVLHLMSMRFIATCVAPTNSFVASACGIGECCSPVSNARSVCADSAGEWSGYFQGAA